MRFRHSLLHIDALRRAESAPWRDAVRLCCPLCAQPYYGVTLRGLWTDDEVLSFADAAAGCLARECPDHPHTFEVAAVRPVGAA